MKLVLLAPEGSKGQPARDLVQRLVDELGTDHLVGDTLLSYLWPKKTSTEELAKYHTALNFHPAPLPEYKGFAPYTFGILHNEHEWAASCHLMTDKIDAGPIVQIRRFGIRNPDNTTAAELQAQTLPYLLDTLASEVTMLLAGNNPKVRARPNDNDHYYSRADFECERMNRDGDPDRYRRAFHCPPHKGWLE